MTVHNGAILCLNCLSFGSNPKTTRDEEHTAIVEAYKVSAAQGAKPGAIVLQDYEWASESGLTILVNLMNEATGAASWKAVRQWGDEQDSSAESLRDAVVLFDSSVYIGTGIGKECIGAFRDTDDLLAGMQPDIKAQLSDFIGRWAGVELEVLDAAGNVTDLTYVLVSYHGRKMMRAYDDLVTVQTAVKAAMTKDFVAQVADLAATESVPALVAGCFNIDSMPLTANGGYHSDNRSKAPWNTTVHVPEGIEKDHIGQPKGKVDYAVAIHPAEGANTKTDLKVMELVTLNHPANIATHFQHKPLLLKINIAPKA